MDGYKQYIRTDANGIVILGFTSAFPEIATPQPGDLLLSGEDGRHFQTQLTNERGQFIYKVVGGQMVERTQAELDAEWNARPPEPETDAQKIMRLEAANAIINQRLAQTNDDAVGFQNFIFEKFPDLA